MTRGMLVTVLYRMNGSPSVSGKTPFTDVRTDEWYSAAVLWAYQNGIVTGMSDTCLLYTSDAADDPLPLHENGRPGQGQSLRRPERFCRRGQRE